MQLTKAIKYSVTATCQVSTVSIDEARTWIGRRLVLRKTLLGFEPGTHGIVMCVVDFGDGLLLWIVTDDNRLIDIEQIALPLVSEYFRLIPPETLDLASSEEFSLNHK